MSDHENIPAKRRRRRGASEQISRESAEIVHYRHEADSQIAGVYTTATVSAMALTIASAITGLVILAAIAAVIASTAAYIGLPFHRMARATAAACPICHPPCDDDPYTTTA